MAELKFDKEITALLIIDPYNDFISEGGKIWDRIRNVLRDHSKPASQGHFKTGQR